MKRKSGFGWSELIVGILLTALGIVTFVQPEGTLTGAVVIYGVIVIVMGIEDIVVYTRLSRFTGFGPMLSLISGILSVMCGIMLVANPNLGKWALTILLPVWFIAHCISGLTSDRKFLLLLFLPGFEYSRPDSRLFDDFQPGAVLCDDPRDQLYDRRLSDSLRNREYHRCICAEEYRMVGSKAGQTEDRRQAYVYGRDLSDA